MKNSISKNIARVFGDAILGLGFIGTIPAQAAIINHTDVNGLRTFQDVGTGLVWVDLDNFISRSTIEMKTIVEAAGFTFANKSSVQTLLGGLPLTNPPTEWNSYATSIIGNSPGWPLMFGTYDDGDNNTSVGYAFSFNNSPQWTIGDNAYEQSDPNGLMNIFAYQSPSPTAVPEPFTIIGTLVGGSAALRMRKKLKSDNKT
jgi:hypothetical protein